MNKAFTDADYERVVRERDEALARVIDAALIHADLVRERDEARAEVERLKSESKIEQAFTNKYIKRLHDAEAKGADQFRRGAEAMREACARWIDPWVSEVLAEEMRTLPIPLRLLIGGVDRPEEN